MLFELLELPCGARIKNRFFKSVSEGLSTIYHRPSSFLSPLYRRWGEGGAGIIVMGNVMIDRTALGEPRNVVIEDDSDMPLYEKWAEAGTHNGPHCWVQLNHPGKQSPKALLGNPYDSGQRTILSSDFITRTKKSSCVLIII